MAKQCKCGKWTWTPGEPIEDIPAIPNWQHTDNAFISVSDGYLRGDGPNRGERFCDVCGVQLQPGGEIIDWRALAIATQAMKAGKCHILTRGMRYDRDGQTVIFCAHGEFHEGCGETPEAAVAALLEKQGGDDAN